MYSDIYILILKGTQKNWIHLSPSGVRKYNFLGGLGRKDIIIFLFLGFIFAALPSFVLMNLNILCVSHRILCVAR